MTGLSTLRCDAGRLEPRPVAVADALEVVIDRSATESRRPDAEEAPLGGDGG